MCLGRLQFWQLLQWRRQTAQSEETQWQNPNRQIIKLLNASLQVRLARLWGITGGLPQTGRTQTKTYRRETISMQKTDMQLRHCSTLQYDHSRTDAQVGLIFRVKMCVHYNVKVHHTMFTSHPYYSPVISIITLPNKENTPLDMHTIISSATRWWERHPKVSPLPPLCDLAA